MTERISKGMLVAGAAALFLPALAFFAYSRPWYFTSPTYVGGLALLECMLAAIFLYRQVFFPLVIITFLMAGSNLPTGGGSWIAGRWVVLGVGALVGSFVMLKERRHHFGLFHALAVFAILSAIVSAAVSRYEGFVFLKAFSLLLLFVYAGTGARLAVTGRENQFFHGLLTGCEVFVAAMGAFYAAGIEAMGNPNSLGAVMGVVAAPVLLWGTLLDQSGFARRRRQVLYFISMYLAFHSHSRASLAAALFSCGILCLSLRQYKLLGQGVVIITIIVASSAILDPEGFSRMVSALNSSVLYKGGDPRSGLFASRQAPWQAAIESIHSHFWFGSGFGTTENGQDASADLSSVETSLTVTSENGSSYLSILSWVGVLGVIPFALLLFALGGAVLRVILWALHTRDPGHPAIPLAMVMVAGLVHAGFEDWLFAVGYYLCMFYWSLAFVLVDITPYARLPRFSQKWLPEPVQRPWNGAAQSQ